MTGTTTSGFLRELDEWRRECMAQAWDEGNRHESQYLDTWGQFDPNPVNPYRVTPPGLTDAQD